MILVADIGNTSTTVGVFKDNKLIAQWFLTSDKKRSEDEYGILLSNLITHAKLDGKIKGAAISSVVIQLTKSFSNAIEKYVGVIPFIVTHKTNGNIEIAIDKPEEIGADRLVNAFAVNKIYKTSAIVVDFGTATTLDVVNNNKFLGGVITAGIKIQADALADFTSKLPKVKIEAPKNTIGRNTIDAMLSGLVRGHACMIEGLINSCEKELNQKVTTIATGGYTSIIGDNLSRKFDVIDEHLTIKGLNLLWHNYND